MKHRSRLVVAAISAVLRHAPAVAQQVGTATAVNPLSESTPPGGATAPLVVGAHIVHNESIHTTPDGTVQLRFTDRSSMSIAPNTEIVINEYVYDPNAKNGHMLVTLTEGALRYVGGQLSHNGETTITTTAATIGIRGGTATIVKDAKGTEVINHFGDITIHNGGGDFTLLRPDFGALGAQLANSRHRSRANPPSRDRILCCADDQQGTRTAASAASRPPISVTADLAPCRARIARNHFWSPTNNGELDSNQILQNATNFGTASTSPPSHLHHHRLRHRDR